MKRLSFLVGLLLPIVASAQLIISPSGGGGAFDPAAPGAIGGTTPAAGSFTTLGASGQIQSGNGNIASAGLALGTTNTGFSRTGAGLNEISAAINGTAVFAVTSEQGLYANKLLLDYTNGDVVLVRDAANTLALRNGTAAQLFNTYNTWTNASNYERLVLGYSTNIALILSGAAGSGTFRPMIIGTNGDAYLKLRTNAVDRWTIDGTNGHFLAGTDNTYDIGASGATRPRNIYAAGTINGGSVISAASVLAGDAASHGWSNRGYISAPSDGVIILRNTALTDFTRLELGEANMGVMRGTGSPESTVTGKIGSLYLRLDGGAGTTLYVKESGTGNTGWIAK